MDKPNKNLLWDLGKTLVKIDEFSFARKIGLLDIALYSLFNGSRPQDIIGRSLDLLDTIELPGTDPCSTTIEGRPLPPIVCSWFEGKLSNATVNNYLQTPLMLTAPEGFFKSKREARLIENVLKTITNPVAFASSISIIDQAMTLLKECSEQYDDHGNQRHRLFIFSNWDSESFDSMTHSSHLQKLFSFFDTSNLIISGKTGYLKPHDIAYVSAIKTYNLVPSDCILIDDQLENIAAAQKNGMRGILLENENYSNVREKLCLYNVLES